MPYYSCIYQFDLVFFRAVKVNSVNLNDLSINTSIHFNVACSFHCKSHYQGSLFAKIRHELVYQPILQVCLWGVNVCPANISFVIIKLDTKQLPHPCPFIPNSVFIIALLSMYVDIA